MQSKAILMDSEVVGRTLKRLSYVIVEKTDNLDDLVLVGIRTRGVPICQTLAQNIKQAMGHEVPMGELDITLYRDDLSAIDAAPVLNGTKIDFDLTDRDVVLVDDVIYTGRTVRAAIDAVYALGRPKTIRLAVLVDRGHRELPIRADFVGKNIPTSHAEMIRVRVREIDGEDAVAILQRVEANEGENR